MNSILLLGSSFIRKINLQRLNSLRDYTIANHGISRLTSNMLLTPKYISCFNNNNYSPKFIVFYCGNNDLFLGVDKKVVCNNIRQFIDILIGLYPNTKIIIISIIKSPRNKELMLLQSIDYINSYLSNIRSNCSSSTFSNVFYININRQIHNHYDSDNIHLNAKGYDIVSRILNEFFITHS